MNSEQEKELLDFLASLGFRGEEFELEVKKHIAEGRPVFKVKYDVEFGKAQMLFDLMLIKDYQFNAYRLDHYKAVYKDDPVNTDPDFAREPYRDFIPTKSGFCNVDLAYHYLSNSFDNLYTKLLPIGLEKFPGMDVYSLLEKELSQNPDRFEINHWFNSIEGFASIHLEITKENNGYDLETYSLHFTPYSNIDHGIFNGVDTGELEVLMQQIDWLNDQDLYVFSNDDKRSALDYSILVTEVIDQMHLLEQDSAAQEIMMQLQLKYWACTRINDRIEARTWNYLRSLPVKRYEFAATVEVKTAFNLMCGRTVPENLLHSFLPNSENWIRLDFSKEEPEVIVTSFTTEEFEQLVTMLPLLSSDLPKVLYPLVQGSLVEVTARNGSKLFLEANPEQQTINIYSADMRPVLTNIMLKPDWNPLKDHDKMWRNLRKEVNEDISLQQRNKGKGHSKGKGL